MENRSSPGHGQEASPGDEEGVPSELLGEPDMEGLPRQVAQDDGVQGEQNRDVQEDLARHILEGCEGMEPPCEYISVEGFPDCQDEDGSAPAPARSLQDAEPHGAQPQPQGDEPLLNGVGPVGRNRDQYVWANQAPENQRNGPHGTSGSDVEELLRQLLLQNQAPHDELAYMRQEGTRGTTSESEGTVLYSGRNGQRRNSNASSGLSSVGEGQVAGFADPSVTQQLHPGQVAGFADPSVTQQLHPGQVAGFADPSVTQQLHPGQVAGFADSSVTQHLHSGPVAGLATRNDAQDLAPKAHIWWALVLEEAKRSYRLWMAATPLERITIQGTPSDDLRSDKYVRLESRALAMLSKAVPASIYDHVLSVRNTTCCGLVFFVLKAYQPGGLHETTELLKGLTVLGECTTAKQGVESLSVWARHLERARGMNVAIPDCTLLLDALDSISRSLLERHPALLFRMNSTRMSLQLDTIPTLASVEQYAKSLTAELEVIAVSGVDGGAASKKQKVASLATAGEATQLLQSMRISSLRTHIKAATQLRDLGEGRRQRDLIDGGATACLRTARSGEYQLPTLSVELACGSCKLHINSAGTLLSRQPVAPIVSAAALLELGYRIQWSKDSCQVSHPTRGQLEVDASSGCPEIGQEIALQLIAEYEEHVKSKDVHEARVRCLLKDLRRESTEQLARLMLAGGVEAALPCPALPCPGSADLWRKLPEAGNEAEVASENEAGSTSEEDEDGVAKPVYGAGKRPPLDYSSYGQAAMVC
eukprot:s4987_g2.t1